VKKASPLLDASIGILYLKYIVAYFWAPLKGVLRTLVIFVPPFFNLLSKKIDRIEIKS